MGLKQASKPAASLDDVLYNAVLSGAKADDKIRDAFIAAGGNQDKPKQIVLVARMVHGLKCTREVALITLGKKGNPGKKPDVGDGVRTVKEEQAYGAARGYLTACLKRWGLQSTEGRGGDRTKESDAMNTEKLSLPGKPKVETIVELAAYAMAYAKGGYDLFLLNKAHSAVTNAQGSELMGAFADFVNTITEINAKHAK